MRQRLHFYSDTLGEKVIRTYPKKSSHAGGDSSHLVSNLRSVSLLLCKREMVAANQDEQREAEARQAANYRAQREAHHQMKAQIKTDHKFQIEQLTADLQTTRQCVLKLRNAFHRLHAEAVQYQEDP